MIASPAMTRSAIHTSNAAPPAGPYSQAIQAGNMLLVSGQLPLDPNGVLVRPGDIKAQTKQIFDNIAAILREAGSSLDQVVKTTVFLTSLDDFSSMNEVYASIFKPPYPARSTIEIGRLPGGMLLEIECIALVERTPS